MEYDWDEIYWGGDKSPELATGGIIDGAAGPQLISGGCVIAPGQIYVGDVVGPWTGRMNPWPGPGWYWDEFTQGWKQHPLTYPSTTTTFDLMARSEVIEYTETRFPTGSTAVEEAWYNENTQRMTLRFPRGGLYSYDEVSPELWREFIDAESMGRFFAQTFNSSTGNKWEGAKHVESRTKFALVEVERPAPEPDLDAFKVNLTMGRGTQEFTVHFQYTADTKMAVRATSVEEAVKAVEDYAKSKGFAVEVEGVYQPIKKGKNGK